MKPPCVLQRCVPPLPGSLPCRPVVERPIHRRAYRAIACSCSSRRRGPAYRFPPGAAQMETLHLPGCLAPRAAHHRHLRPSEIQRGRRSTPKAGRVVRVGVGTVLQRRGKEPAATTAPSSQRPALTTREGRGSHFLKSRQSTSCTELITFSDSVIRSIPQTRDLHRYSVTSTFCLSAPRSSHLCDARPRRSQRSGQNPRRWKGGGLPFLSVARPIRRERPQTLWFGPRPRGSWPPHARDSRAVPKPHLRRCCVVK
jgi:hypothetical protein